jgi:3D-(3,5/4)-trihydroxycyclohexane-1,2-dione acylhydrolase (decyclizing)
MLTGAALATINRLPVLLLPSDTFATRVSAPVLQQLEAPNDGEVTVNDAFKPLSRFFDRVWRPEQLPSALLGAMRVLTDPVETGATTIALPQDVQAEAYDWPESLFAERTWHVARPVPERSVIARAAEVIRSAQRPLIVAGGGVIYSGADDALAAFVEETGIPASETQAGKGSLRYDHPQSVGAIGATGTTAANALAAEADVVIGIGTRYSDFTSASRTAFNDPLVRFVNVNVASFDAVKQGGLSVVADAREALDALSDALGEYSVGDEYRARTAELARNWDDTVSTAYKVENDGRALNQSQVIGLANTLSDPRDVVVCAAGSMPGDLHKLWRTRERKGYHVEYGYSCMGYEIAGALGVKMAFPEREVYVMVGDGSYLMMNSEIASAVTLGCKLILVVLDNRGYGCINRLQQECGSAPFNNLLKDVCGSEDGVVHAVDFAKHAESLGAVSEKVTGVGQLNAALARARASRQTYAIVIDTDPAATTVEGGAWWDVVVPEVSSRPEVQAARAKYELSKARQRV